MTERVSERMLEECFQHGAKWVIVKGKLLRLRTRDMCHIPRLQFLETASNQFEFIMKSLHSLMAILNQDPIDVGLLVVDKIKFMSDVPQRACGCFCIINELCILDRVPSHPNDMMVSIMLPIN